MSNIVKKLTLKGATSSTLSSFSIPITLVWINQFPIFFDFWEAESELFQTM